MQKAKTTKIANCKIV